jgi:hypothetical protein
MAVRVAAMSVCGKTQYAPGIKAPTSRLASNSTAGVATIAEMALQYGSLL